MSDNSSLKEIAFTDELQLGIPDSCHTYLGLHWRRPSPDTSRQSAGSASHPRRSRALPEASDLFRLPARRPGGGAASSWPRRFDELGWRVPDAAGGSSSGRRLDGGDRLDRRAGGAPGLQPRASSVPSPLRGLGEPELCSLHRNRALMGAASQLAAAIRPPCTRRAEIPAASTARGPATEPPPSDGVA